MKLRVILTRYSAERRHDRTLSAFVEQEGVRGSNILAGRSLMNVETARQAILRELHRFGIPRDAEIQFVMEGEEARNV